MKRQDGRSYLRQRCQCQSCADSWVPWLDPARHAARHAESQRFTVTPWLSGAGKTTMVQHILKNREGLKAVVFPEQFLGKLMENPWKTHGLPMIFIAMLDHVGLLEGLHAGRGGG